MKKVTGKRVLAYLMDILFVYCIVNLFSSIEFLNPNLERYEKTYIEYQEVYTEYLDAYSNNGSMLDEVTDQITNLSYDIARYSMPNYIINVVICILYFAAFQYYNKGQTIAMKLFKIKVVNEDKKQVSFMQILGRSLLIYSIATSALSILLLSWLSKATYIQYGGLVTAIDGVVIIGSLILMMFRKDGKGIHDIFMGTNVISTKELDDTKEANYTEKITTKKEK